MTALEIARRARSNNVWQSSLESRDILRILAPFEKSQAAPLFHASIHAAPEFLKVLNRRNDRASHNQPQQRNTERLEDFVLRRQDHGADGHDLQDHLRLAKRGCGNCETFGGSDVAKTQDNNFPPD